MINNQLDVGVYPPPAKHMAALVLSPRYYSPMPVHDALVGVTCR